MSRSSKPVLVAAVFVAVVSTAFDATAFCRTTTGSPQVDPSVCPNDGVPIAWPGGCAALSIDPRNVPSEIGVTTFRDVVDSAAQRWSGADCGGGVAPTFHFVQFPDCAHGAEWNPDGRNANVVTFRTTWGEDSLHTPSAIAVTVTTYATATGAIRDADTELNLQTAANPDGFVFTTGEPMPSAVDLGTVVTHELGHSQGLAHSPETSAVMWFRAGLGEQRQQLSSDDIAGICEIYPQSHSASCDPTPRNGFSCDTGCSCAVPGRPSSPPSARLTWVALLAVGIFAQRRRRPWHRSVVLAAGTTFALAACDDHHAPARSAVTAPAPAPFDWQTRADGTLQPPDGPCDNDNDCRLNGECGCDCFATRTDFVDRDHRCTRCNAQVPFCRGARVHCDSQSRRCVMER